MPDGPIHPCLSAATARRLFPLFNFRFLFRRKMQTGLCLLGIALGVAVMVAIDAANRGALASFRQSVDLVAGKATHQIVATGQADLPEQFYSTLRTLPGVVAAAPVIEQAVKVREAGGEMLRLLGTDLFSEAPFRSAGNFQGNSRSGGDGDRGGDGFDLGGYLALPGRVLIPESFALRHGLHGHCRGPGTSGKTRDH
jgi:putative ABC transport system permease protein